MVGCWVSLPLPFLEPFFIRQLDLGAILKVGLIEEFAKILGVLAIARHRRHDSEMDGLILGGAAGMGFAALESNGYAFTAFLDEPWEHFDNSGSDLDPRSAFPAGARNLDSDFSQRTIP